MVRWSPHTAAAERPPAQPEVEAGGCCRLEKILEIPGALCGETELQCQLMPWTAISAADLATHRQLIIPRPPPYTAAAEAGYPQALSPYMAEAAEARGPQAGHLYTLAQEERQAKTATRHPVAAGLDLPLAVLAESESKESADDLRLHRKRQNHKPGCL